jgi:hypothetical protein
LPSSRDNSLNERIISHQRDQSPEGTKLLSPGRQAWEKKVRKTFPYAVGPRAAKRSAQILISGFLKGSHDEYRSNE